MAVGADWAVRGVLQGVPVTASAVGVEEAELIMRLQVRGQVVEVAPAGTLRNSSPIPLGRTTIRSVLVVPLQVQVREVRPAAPAAPAGSSSKSTQPASPTARSHPAPQANSPSTTPRAPTFRPPH